MLLSGCQAMWHFFYVIEDVYARVSLSMVLINITDHSVNMWPLSTMFRVTMYLSMICDIFVFVSNLQVSDCHTNFNIRQI